MKEKYPYRFKTKTEFEDEYGDYWYLGIQSGRWLDEMDKYFGIVYPFTQKQINTYGCNFPPMEGWCAMSFDMLTRNEPIKPNYKSRKIERVL